MDIRLKPSPELLKVEGDGNMTACLTVAPLPPSSATDSIDSWRLSEDSAEMVAFLAEKLNGAITEDIVKETYDAWDSLDEATEEGDDWFGERQHVLNWLRG